MAAEFRIGALVTLAATSGLRQGELLGLEWSDIDWSAGTLTVRRSMARAWDGGYELAGPNPRAAGGRCTWRTAAIAALSREQRSRRWRGRRRVAPGRTPPA